MGSRELILLKEIKESALYSDLDIYSYMSEGIEPKCHKATADPSRRTNLFNQPLNLSGRPKYLSIILKFP